MLETDPEYDAGANLARTTTISPNHPHLFSPSAPVLYYPPNPPVFSNGILPADPGLSRYSTNQPRPSISAVRSHILGQSPSPAPTGEPASEFIVPPPQPQNTSTYGNSDTNNCLDNGRSMFMTVDVDEVVAPPTFWKRHKQVILALGAGTLIFMVITAVVIFILTFTKDDDDLYPDKDEVRPIGEGHG